MRRTVLSAAALACTAVLASAMPAFADDPSPVPDTKVAESATPTPAQEAAPEDGEPAPAEDAGGVTVVPRGAPDTGTAPASAESGGDGALIGGGAAAVLAGGGAAVFLVRRRRATAE
ncbi:hypothetical protein HTV45_04595 [Streptomyces sp. CHD11]|uniref:hypothetical protein n=1 Tax=Streptomyces sp. CHD11 TaxID=2741325 RepID=UPI001BFC1F78|nr:hypothetical protein [Streptomyces sp. CHD11]MBT3150172.1 hypothetical protein [Streptomyces sp. CHD11]